MTSGALRRATDRQAEGAAPALRLELFGAPRMMRGNVEIRLPVKKVLALLCYVAVEGRVSRARLADLLWGDLEEATGRRNLRRALHRLRNAGLGDAIDIHDEHVGPLRAANDLDSPAVGAAAVGRRPLDGLDLDDAPAFSEWLAKTRERLDRRIRTDIEAAARGCEERGDIAGAIDGWSRLAEADPLHEEAHRELMRLHDARGERTLALAVYARCEQALRSELNLDPLPETRRLAERLRDPAQGTAHVEPAQGLADARRVAAAAIDSSAERLVGRDRELNALVASTHAVTLVEGDPGIGKSRLVLEAALRASKARQPDGAAPPVVVRFAEMSSATPFQAIAEALRSAALSARLEGLDPTWRQELARLLPEWRSADAPARQRELSGDEARSRLLEAIARALAVVAHEAGGVVVLDDLQWADASSLELLELMARRRLRGEAEAPRVLAAARSTELADNGAAGVALRSIAAAGGLGRSMLAPLDDWSMLQLVQLLSKSAGGVRFAARLRSATGGNPFFAIETIRSLIEAGELHVDATEGWSTRYDDTTVDYAELPLPASVVEAIRVRIARLGAATTRMLETAALAESGSTLDELRGATALSDWEALEGVERAIGANVVARDGTGYRFVHDLFRFAIASGLTPERQRLVHAKLAAALEPLKAAPARVAAHWQAAGDAARAATAWALAGEEAAALHAHREAATHFEQAAVLAANDDTVIDLYDRAFTHWAALRAHEERDALVSRALEHAERRGSPEARFMMLLRAGEAASHARRYDDAERHARRALELGDSRNPRWQVHAYSIIAFSAAHLGRLDEALATYRRAIAHAQARSIDSAVAMMAGAAAWTATQLDRLDEAVVLRDQALTVGGKEMAGSERRASLLGKLHMLSRALGDRATAMAQLGEAIEITTATKNATYAMIHFANLCETLVDDGQAAAAAECHRRVAAVVRGGGADDEHDYLVALTGAVVDELHGDLGAALARARAAVAAADRIGDEADRREARFLLARLLSAIGAEDRAVALAEEAAGIVAPGWDLPFLPLAVRRASASLAAAPDVALAGLVEAMRAPYADRRLHPVKDAARVLVGRCHVMRGRADDARAAVRDVFYSTAVQADACAVRLAAARLDGRDIDGAAAAATGWLEGGRSPPLNALDLMAGLAPLQRGKRAAAAWRERQVAAAQALADTLAGEPPVQAAFIRRHRDLLT